MQWVGQFSKVADNSPIVGGEAEKLMNFMNIPWGWEFPYSLDQSGGCLKAIVCDDVSQVRTPAHSEQSDISPASV